MAAIEQAPPEDRGAHKGGPGPDQRALDRLGLALSAALGVPVYAGPSDLEVIKDAGNLLRRVPRGLPSEERIIRYRERTAEMEYYVYVGLGLLVLVILGGVLFGRGR